MQLEYLGASPHGRALLTETGRKITSCYRKLSKRRGDSIGSLLVREDHVHDEIQQALDRLVHYVVVDEGGTQKASVRAT